MELNKETLKIGVLWLIGGALFITGVQLVLLLPLYLFDVLSISWEFFPHLTLWKGILTLVLGIAMMIAGGKLAEPGEKQFFDSNEGENP